MVIFLGSCQCASLSTFWRKVGQTSRLIINAGSVGTRPSTTCYFSTQSSLSTRSSPAHTQRVRKKRDKFTVLRALASTVQPSHFREDYRIINDPFLKFQSGALRDAMFEAMESGEKAAEEVIERNKDLVTMQLPVPAWDVPIFSSDDITIENLRKLMLDENTNLTGEKVIEWYKKLKADGLNCIELENEILDYASFHAIPDGNLKEGNFAENLFEDLADRRCGISYEVFILGLLKHRSVKRAFQVYNQMKEENLNGSVNLFNSLLQNIKNRDPDVASRWNLALDIVSHMRRGKVKANVQTFNELMSIAVENENALQLCIRLMREMRSLGITPSLGSYYLLLKAEFNCSKSINKTNRNIFLIREVIEDIASGKVTFEYMHPTDKLFFDQAMVRARYVKDTPLHITIMDIMESNKLQSWCDKAFYGHYLTCVCQHDMKFEEVYEKYCQIVPHKTLPLPWIYQELFSKMCQVKDPTYLPELYRESKKYRLNLQPKTIFQFFMVAEVNVPVEKASSFAEVIEDVELEMEEKAQHNLQTISVAMNIYILADRYEKIMEKITEANSLQILLPKDIILKALQMAVDKKKKDDVLKILQSSNSDEMWDKRQFIRELLVNSEMFNEGDYVIQGWM